MRLEKKSISPVEKKKKKINKSIKQGLINEKGFEYPSLGRVS